MRINSESGILISDKLNLIINSIVKFNSLFKFKSEGVRLLFRENSLYGMFMYKPTEFKSGIFDSPTDSGYVSFKLPSDELVNIPEGFINKEFESGSTYNKVINYFIDIIFNNDEIDLKHGFLFSHGDWNKTLCTYLSEFNEYIHKDYETQYVAKPIQSINQNEVNLVTNSHEFIEW